MTLRIFKRWFDNEIHARTMDPVVDPAYVNEMDDATWHKALTGALLTMETTATQEGNADRWCTEHGWAPVGDPADPRREHLVALFETHRRAAEGQTLLLVLANGLEDEDRERILVRLAEHVTLAVNLGRSGQDTDAPTAELETHRNTVVAEVAQARRRVRGRAEAQRNHAFLDRDPTRRLNERTGNPGDDPRTPLICGPTPPRESPMPAQDTTRYHDDDAVHQRRKRWFNTLCSTDAMKSRKRLALPGPNDADRLCVLGVAAVTLGAERAWDPKLGKIWLDDEAKRLSRYMANELDVTPTGDFTDEVWIARAADGTLHTELETTSPPANGDWYDSLTRMNDCEQLEMTLAELGAWLKEHHRVLAPGE